MLDKGKQHTLYSQATSKNDITNGPYSPWSQASNQNSFQNESKKERCVLCSTSIM